MVISIAKIWSVARAEFVKWLKNPRMIILVIVLVFINNCAVEPLLEHAEKVGSPLNILEPFIAVGNSDMLVLIIPAVFLTLMSDFPRIDAGSMFFVVRTGKLNWFLGQIVFSLLSIVSYMAVIFAGATVPLFNKAFWGNGWSLAVTRYATMFPDDSQSFASMLITGRLYNQMMPFYAALQTALLLICYLFLISMIMLLFNLMKNKILGVFCVCAVMAIGAALCFAQADAMWAAPMANAMIWLHYTELFSQPIKPVWCSYAYFIAIILALLACSLIKLKKYNIDSINEI